MKKIVSIAASFAFIFLSISCSNSQSASSVANQNRQPQATDSRGPTLIAHEVVASYPHDPRAFLQGLLWHDGGFYESTGQRGESTLRRVEFPSGRVIKKHDLAPEYFGEGLALVGDKLIQLTWDSNKGFVYDRESFRPVQEFSYTTEGWGLTFDGKSLILSDGTSELTFLDPQTFKPLRKQRVTFNSKPVDQINELEFIEGEIWANVWKEDVILRIDPATGAVNSYLNLKDIRPRETLGDSEAVLNGIAYDAAQKRIFVSGKRWPRIFEIRLR